MFDATFMGYFIGVPCLTFHVISEVVMIVFIIFPLPILATQLKF